MDVNPSMPAYGVPRLPIAGIADDALHPPTVLPVDESPAAIDSSAAASLAARANPNTALSQMAQAVQEIPFAQRAALGNFSQSRQVVTPRKSASLGRSSGQDLIPRRLHEEVVSLSLSEKRVKEAVRDWTVSDNHISELKETLRNLTTKIDGTPLAEKKQLQILWNKYEELSETVMNRVSRLYNADVKTALSLLEQLIQNDDRHVSYDNVFKAINTDSGFERFILDHVKAALSKEISEGSEATMLRQSSSFEYKLITILQNGYLSKTMDQLDEAIKKIQGKKLQVKSGDVVKVKVEKTAKASLQLLDICIQGLNDKDVRVQLKEIYQHLYQQLMTKCANLAPNERTAYVDNKLINFYFLRSVNAKLASGGMGTSSELLAKTFQKWLSYDPQSSKEEFTHKQLPIFTYSQKGRNLYDFMIENHSRLLLLLTALKKTAHGIDSSSAASAAIM